MLNSIKKNSIKLSIVASLALTPSAVFAASASGVIDGSSESTSALIEGPNVEQQINRINVGIALVRLNTVILNEMPISGDSKWADELTQPMTTNMYTKVRQSNAIKNDPYFSTALLTNVILRRAALGLSPLNARLYVELNAIYKNDTNELMSGEHKNYSVPDIYELPSFDDMKTFTNFGTENNGMKVEKIEVEAAQYEKFANVEDATISLAPKKYQKSLLEIKEQYKKAKEDVALSEGIIASTEEWMKDDANANSPQRDKKAELLSLEEQKLTTLEDILNEKDDAYSVLIEEAALAIESFQSPEYLEAALPLALKLEKLLDTVDNNAIGAMSMFTAATAHLTKNGVGTLDQEMKALLVAQVATNLVGNQKEFLVERLSRMGTGALMALPNIFIGSYYASKQILEAGKYQTIVNKVIEIAEAAKEQSEEK